MANFVRTAINDFGLPNAAYIGATVEFLAPDGAGNPTTTFVTLYADLTGPDTLPNPQILDGAGKFQQPVYIEEPVVARVSIPGEPDDETTGVIRPSLSQESVMRSIMSAGESRAMAAEAGRQAKKAKDSAASLSQGTFVLAAQSLTRWR